MKPRGLTIILLMAVAVTLALGAINSGGAGKSDMNRALSQEEMTRVFGSACNACTLGESKQICGATGCPPCKEAMACGLANKSAGNYVTLCVTKGGIEDGTCWEDEEVTCEETYICSKTGGYWENRTCDVNCGHDGDHPCVECEEGGLQGTTTSHSYTCVCS